MGFYFLVYSFGVTPHGEWTVFKERRINRAAGYNFTTTGSHANHLATQHPSEKNVFTFLSQ